jgi:peptidoglycan hydrolase-like protein with peptidoglycan-binding domain
MPKVAGICPHLSQRSITVAHIETTNDPNLPTLLNVDQAVGSTGSHSNPIDPGVFPMANRRDDVLLVQYLLKDVYGNANAFAPPLQRPAGPDMAVDGYFGPQTRQWIQHFQLESRRRGNNIATDGVVDPARHGTAAATISTTFYTIVLLNLAFRKARPGFFPNVALDRSCPAELKAALLSRPPARVNVG